MKRIFTDQTGNTIEINFPPKRIISLVPSQTELLYDLGLDEEVIAQTLFCIHPKDQHEKKPRIGGTKKLNIEKIRSLHPDLIIANKEENEKDQIEILMQEFPVWTSDIHDLDDALNMIAELGKITENSEAASGIIELTGDSFRNINKASGTVAYLIWKDPYMSAGNDTFIHSMLTECGFTNVLEKKKRYPEINLEELKSIAPDYIFLSSEPYPFKQKHIDELRSDLPNSKILLVDGEYFSWYGSRLLGAADYFDKLIMDLTIKPVF